MKRFLMNDEWSTWLMSGAHDDEWGTWLMGEEAAVDEDECSA